MPQFQSDGKSTPFFNTAVGGSPKPPSSNETTRKNIAASNLKAALRKRAKENDAIKYARTGEAAKKRGEMGMNPSGTQGAKGTEAKYMNPAVYGKRAK